MFTLKVIEDEKTGFMRADNRHLHGGIDMLQIYAFEHLLPGGVCPWTHRELLYGLAEAHGWGVIVTVVKEDTEAEKPNE